MLLTTQSEYHEVKWHIIAYNGSRCVGADATGEWVTTDRDTDRAHSCETDLLTLSGSAEPPLETPHVQPVPSHDEPAVDPASRLQRPPNPPQQHLVIVSNRLPVNLTFDASTRKWSLPISSGGLVSALMGVGNVRSCPYQLVLCCLHCQAPASFIVHILVNGSPDMDR